MRGEQAGQRGGRTAARRDDEEGTEGLGCAQHSVAGVAAGGEGVGQVGLDDPAQAGLFRRRDYMSVQGEQGDLVGEPILRGRQPDPADPSRVPV